jgi:flagellar hook assembly protein FlgD
VSLEIFNVTGQHVRTLVDERVSSGYHEVTWNGENDAGMAAASGIYFYRLKSSGFEDTRKMILMK